MRASLGWVPKARRETVSEMKPSAMERVETIRCKVAGTSYFAAQDILLALERAYADGRASAKPEIERAVREEREACAMLVLDARAECNPSEQYILGCAAKAIRSRTTDAGGGEEGEG